MGVVFNVVGFGVVFRVVVVGLGVVFVVVVRFVVVDCEGVVNFVVGWVAIVVGVV